MSVLLNVGCQYLKTYKFGCSTQIQISRFKTRKRQICSVVRAETTTLQYIKEKTQLPDGLWESLQCNPPPTQFFSLINDSGNSLSLDWWAGFLLYRGCFEITFSTYRKVKNSLCGVYICCQFQIWLQSKSVHILMALYDLFGRVGTIRRVDVGKQQFWKYVVNPCDLCDKVLPILDQIPFQGKKYQQYQFFRAIATSYHSKNRNGDDLAQYTLFKCINQYIIDRNLKSQQKILQKIYSDLQDWLEQQERGHPTYAEKNKWKYQLIKINQKKDMTEDFVVGLMDGLGTFSVVFVPRYTSWPLISVRTCFEISHRDEQLLQDLQQRFFENCGQIFKSSKNTIVRYKVCKLDDIVNIVIPFFLRNPLLSTKYYDFERFATIAYKLYFVKKISNDNMKEILQFWFQDKKQGRRNDCYSEDELVEILDIAKSSKELKQLQPQLKQIREQLDEKRRQQRLQN